MQAILKFVKSLGLSEIRPEVIGPTEYLDDFLNPVVGYGHDAAGRMFVTVGPVVAVSENGDVGNETYIRIFQRYTDSEMLVIIANSPWCEGPLGPIASTETLNKIRDLILDGREIVENEGTPWEKRWGKTRFPCPNCGAARNNIFDGVCGDCYDE